MARAKASGATPSKPLASPCVNTGERTRRRNRRQQDNKNATTRSGGQWTATDDDMLHRALSKHKRSSGTPWFKPYRPTRNSAGAHAQNVDQLTGPMKTQWEGVMAMMEAYWTQERKASRTVNSCYFRATQLKQTFPDDHVDA